ncbi:DUF397 domain-containing protein [Streptomyces lunaelactis]|nr:DUF397 domain-containing protein [Streptomyces lunaelactis]NUK38366.1 DUF397 domain-containing protein [Streptomyces lunaelactis]NUK45405.1 DUF397 domain-containing protein [Streptomyces lunaelactis]NUK61471.1 DUF397 domain-containing protein [Streptomyces lunaelactis]NUK96042.1 DUF397 domain-containing protein [Streptomyces lunaelactis]NUL33905.1 DUF397 domain-containing protein [Streptomyces lunaelactis]
MADKPNWRTSSYTGTENCVEVADNDSAVIQVRDSKAKGRGTMKLQPAAWAEFVEFSKGTKL